MSALLQTFVQCQVSVQPPLIPNPDFVQPASASSDGNDSNDGSAEADSTGVASGTVKKGWMAPKTEKCTVCDQTVYIVERLEADGLVYHKVGFERFSPVHFRPRVGANCSPVAFSR